ncbi:MAG: NnrS family protein [Rhodospirillaceae bacterium]
MLRTIFAAPYRPLFLLAALAAAAGGGWWTAALLHGVPMPAGGAAWHGHEMIFGFGGAAAAGYLLTALPSWTQGARVNTWLIVLLCGLWLAGRAAMASSDGPPLAVVGAFPALLAAVLLVKLVRAKAWGRLPFVLLPVGMLVLEGAVPGEHVLRAAVIGFALAIAIIGGRMLPAFARVAPVSTAFDTASLAVLGISILWDSGGLLIVAGLLQAGRMGRWRPRCDALLLMMYAGWIWLPVGLVLLGGSLMRPDLYAPSDALHGLGMGAMGCMVMAIASRALARRNGGPLRATPALTLAFAAVWLSAAARVAAPLAPGLLHGAGVLWVAGWSLFALALAASFARPVPQPVLSGPRPVQRCEAPSAQSVVLPSLNPPPTDHPSPD